MNLNQRIAGNCNTFNGPVVMATLRWPLICMREVSLQSHGEMGLSRNNTLQIPVSLFLENKPSEPNTNIYLEFCQPVNLFYPSTFTCLTVTSISNM